MVEPGSNTAANLDAAFAGESMANRKYLFFAEVVTQLGMKDLAKLFKETAHQETEHAFALFRVMHPELTIVNPDSLSEEGKKAIAAKQTLCSGLHSWFSGPRTAPTIEAPFHPPNAGGEFSRVASHSPKWFSDANGAWAVVLGTCQ